ncbi:tetratricopeptide repeat protein [Pseudorhodobacter ferrugineus]|uniref:tetratricopeptide repeat protein n=1 Tax=Pseudorhodobacter ferrugineus TaxID=77008 RepID=UPI00040D39D5|nr:tetratricopeptide repeat protein [Pseudorhodobacter ferrugineus]
MPFRPLLIATLVAFWAQPLVVQAQTAEAVLENIDSGAYLAARVAGAANDYREAAHWFTRAMIAAPDDQALMEGAIAAHIGAGNMVGAIAVAGKLKAMGVNSPAAELVLMADEAKREDYAALQAKPKDGRTGALLLDGLVNAWAELGTGRMSEALDAFDTMGETEGLKGFALFHKALALASVGDFEGAEAIMSGEAEGAIASMRRGTVAHAQILSQLERNTDAIAVLDASFPGDTDPQIRALRTRLEAGEPVPFDIVRDVTDGLAEVFFTLGLALNGEAADEFTLQYARVAMYLRPDHAEATLLAGAMLENLKQYDLATAAYAVVPQTDGGFFAAEIGRARSLLGADKLDAALEVLTALTRNNPDQLSVHLALADMLRGAERWAEANAAYDAAIALVPQPAMPGYWSVYYSRAIALERQKLWDRAEADFRKALELAPDQPQVLNYLGYSFLERGENFDEALSMIERAVAQRPDSGYIIDSLAWGYFLAGRYTDAVEPMERASVLEPVDPVVTDHLGDVYWAVGRTLEANFQWRRALSFDPTEELATRIRRKLEIGLDAVLIEEGAKSLDAVAND